jgi:DNA-directed RNA polymerase sigma subunit (sigma70/sigma32)
VAPGECLATRVFLARLAPTLDTRDPALLGSLLDQLPPDVRQVLVRTNGLDGRPPAGLKDVARELKMSQGHVRALLATGEEMLAEVVRLLSRPRERA